jgi:hypothetical protein
VNVTPIFWPFLPAQPEPRKVVRQRWADLTHADHCLFELFRLPDGLGREPGEGLDKIAHPGLVVFNMVPKESSNYGVQALLRRSR